MPTNLNGMRRRQADIKLFYIVTFVKAGSCMCLLGGQFHKDTVWWAGLKSYNSNVVMGFI